MSLSHIALLSDHAIELTELRMSSPYGGLLEGYPCKVINDMKISGLRQQAESASFSTPVHLVEPVREHPDATGGGFGPVEVLPAVVCIGFFRSSAIDPELEPVLHRSALTVVWFQPTPDVPSGEDADLALRSIRWEELARDHEL